MDGESTPTPDQTPQAPTGDGQETEAPQQSALVEVMHGVILATVLMVSSYLIGVTYWAYTLGTF
ncbi:hypothetical protein ACFL04_04640 [Patescibacteria group bacterium]